ncbi:MAG: histidine ammonia-lyase [Planctomycetota bacterium]|nr:MAG: histidine ammonia-lyase [Planctomycetota bacterium]
MASEHDRLVIDGERLELAALARWLEQPRMRVELAPQARERCLASRRAVLAMLAEQRAIYGINTGFGRLASRRIGAGKLRELQHNLVRSHCCGVGPALSPQETRLLILLRANALARGLSGVRLELIELLLALLEREVLPVIPEKGSVGASGDLAPLAHLAAVLIGEGEAVFGGERLPGGEALRRAGLSPLELEPKEGLSLINGTQMMTAIGVKAAIETRRLLQSADVVCALTIDALKGTDAAFDPRIHQARPHPGQLAVATNLRRLLAGSAIRESHRGPHCPQVQDAYSLRCAPQVHGASRDALAYVESVLATEINAATDNPLVFAEGAEALSGGNFHGQPVALALDVLAIALAELGAISERRIERLVNPDYSGLPPFLIRAEEGLHSGMMLAQVTAAALTSENKVLAHPACVDSIPTSAGFEDHVSMGVTAALKARECLRNAEAVVAIELLAACQAIEFHRPLTTSPALEAVHALVRAQVPALEGDRPLSADIGRAAELIRTGAVLQTAVAALGEPLR